VSLVERCIGVFVILLLGPTVLVAWLLIRATSGGPVIVRDELTRGDGTVAHGYRFRTTGTGARSISSLGKFLRRYSIDELPVFWSVACGEISLGEAVRCFRSR
jgi:lipopolysaccharide/colanic/teichoic acid biosynthesis glycosyltransferase